MGSDINQIKQDLQTLKDKNHEQEIKIVKLEERKERKRMILHSSVGRACGC